MNFRNGYFYPEEPDDQNTGGLVALLQEAMRKGREQPSAFTPAAFGYGGARSDWLTPVAALSPDQTADQSLRRDNGLGPIQQQDPDFRQLVRVSDPGRLDPKVNGSGATGSQSPAQQPPQIDVSSLDDHGDRSMLPSERVPTKVAQLLVPIPGGRRPILGPFPPAPSDGMSTPNSLPTNIPLPNVPEWWKDARTVLQLFPYAALSLLGHPMASPKSEDGEDDADREAKTSKTGDGKYPKCLDRWDEEYNKCVMFRKPNDDRYKRACEARANSRLRLCYDNKGTPDPNEPDEYWWHDKPNSQEKPRVIRRPPG
jgi:hypothetical protein